ncbi:Na+/H+ antiporter subunit E, partial [Myxococcota bacterium]|nr:Na+/H+ antiporter subunit E [Myxococcota bacterium]
MGIKNFILSFLILFGAWLLLGGTLRSDVLIVGGVLALVVTVIFLRYPQALSTLKVNPRALLTLFVYFWVFLYEFIKLFGGFLFG